MKLKRTLAFGTFVETNDDSFSSSFSSCIFVSLAIFVCLLLLIVIAQKSDREERTCLNPNSLQNPKHFLCDAFLIFKKSVVGAKIRRALFITTDALFPTLSSREERVKLRRVVVFVIVFVVVAESKKRRAAFANL